MNPNPGLGFEHDFIEAAVQRGLGRTSLNALLAVFHKHNIGNFPKDARACVGSLRRVDTISMCDGKYHHFGLLHAVTSALKNAELFSNEISVQICTDGVPVNKSSNNEFWPIMCKVLTPSYDFVSSVFLIGLYIGPGKPRRVDIFLTPLINDLTEAYQAGIYVNGKIYSFSVHSIVCDAVARQFVKCIISHNGYFACERCLVKGEQALGVKFVQTDCEARTDASFRHRNNFPHHKPGQESLFCNLPVDMIQDFPLDYMHLILLGVVKRLIKMWFGVIKKPLTAKSRMYKLSPHHRLITIPPRQAKFSSSVPSEFQRKPRSFALLSSFKATEFRTFLCYTSPVVMKHVFRSPVVYDHFMSLHVAMRILLTPNQSNDVIEYSRRLLKMFVDNFPSIYGRSSCVYNVHSTIHLPDDYLRFGSLDRISSFPFESYLSKIKALVVKHGSELEQVVKRLHELSNFEKTFPDIDSAAQLKGLHDNGPSGPFEREDIVQYSDVCFCGRTFSISSPNNVVFCSSIQAYCLVVNIVSLRARNHLYFVVRRFGSLADVYSYPLNSSEVGVVFAQSLSTEFLKIHIRDVTKCWCVNWCDNNFYIVKLLHESR